MSTSQPSVLLVDDDAAIVTVLSALLEQAGIGCQGASSAAEALARIEARPFDVVISDLRMPGMDGMQFLVEVGRRWPGLPVVLLTAHGTVPLAVEAMKAGAADFLLKPFDRDEVVYVVHKVISRGQAAAERAPASTVCTDELVGSSSVMNEMRDVMLRVAKGPATVLLRGETGTGKELLARAIHKASPRAQGPFITLSCAALPPTLLESELFGYEKGAFTGAANRKPGHVELADGGTFFLDEIGDVPLPVQVKLLRVLQEREVQRLGGTHPTKVDVRFIAATHRDLEAMIRAGEFREDLFYRLSVVPLRVPPLRERPGDVELLAERFLLAFADAYGKTNASIEPAAKRALAAERWPGNVRQLQNFVERLVALSDGSVLTLRDVQRELSRAQGSVDAPPLEVADGGAAESLRTQRRDTERDAIVEALKRAANNRTTAARLLGVSRRTLYNKLAELGLVGPD